MSVVADVYTMPDLLVRAVERDPDGDAVVFPDSRTSYRDLYAQCVRTARSLAALGVSAGDKVGILMANCQEFPGLLIGTQLLGAWPVPINARYKANELAYVIANADLKTLVTTDNVVEHIDFVALLNDGFSDLASQANPRALAAIAVDGADW